MITKESIIRSFRRSVRLKRGARRLLAKSTMLRYIEQVGIDSLLTAHVLTDAVASRPPRRPRTRLQRYVGQHVLLGRVAGRWETDCRWGRVVRR